MKKIALFIMAAAFISTAVSAQITRATTKRTDSVQTLKTKPENIYVKPQADLRFSTLSFSNVSTKMVDGVATHTFEIHYTIKNDGNLAVNANTVTLQGFIFRTNLPTTGGCGRVASTTGEMINPGGSLSGWFRCTLAFDKNNPPLYRLWVDSEHRLNESNEDNNMAQATLIF